MISRLTIVVPVRNEVDNLEPLLSRLRAALEAAGIDYHVVIADDHSTDGSWEEALRLKEFFPLTVIRKRGRRGKAYSILEAVSLIKTEWLVMIDADLQYPPEEIASLVKLAERKPLVGLVVGQRIFQEKVGFLRRLISRASAFINGHMLLGTNVDVQSGLKLVKTEVLRAVSERDVSAWALDIPLIYEAKEMGEKVGAVEIPFFKREKGESKLTAINFWQTSWQIFYSALKCRLRLKKIYHVMPSQTESMIGAGAIYKQKRFITHSTIHHSRSAITSFTNWQKIVALMVVLILVIGFSIEPKMTAIGLTAVLTGIYFIDMLFNFYLVSKSLHFPPEINFSRREIEALNGTDLPVYTILCPLYREAAILPHFVKAMAAMDYPRSKLEVLLLLEKDDQETITVARKMSLPTNFRILVVPDSLPKTKPKACNYGLNHARGEYIVIYDAEDRPDPLQLKKAILGFRRLGSKVVCLQAKLNYYNPHQNFLTRLFTAEYSLWFDVILPALQSIDTTIPLGGTSNHFRTQDLKRLEGWDSFNVAEDADLGIRLFRDGGKTALIDSVTLEEANSGLLNWIRQRSRWLKGYMQTYLVHMREPIKFAREHKSHWLIFQLISGLRLAFVFINPLMWLITLSYFLLYQYVGEAIQTIYPASIFYMAVTSTVFGNFLYLYYYMIGAAKREQWSVIKYIFLVPFYWLLTSLAGMLALYQLVFKPHFWEKTVHGLSLNKGKNSRPFFNGGIWLIAASMVTSASNFLYNAYLGRKIDWVDFGLISLIGSFVYLSNIVFTALSRSVTYRSAYLLGKFKVPVKEFWRKIRLRSRRYALILTGLWLLSLPLLVIGFKADSMLPFLAFTPAWLIGMFAAVDSGWLLGNHLFFVVGLMMMIEAMVKLVSAVILVEVGASEWVYWSIPTSMVVAFLFGWLYIRRFSGNKIKLDQSVLGYFPQRFFNSSLVNNLSTIAFLGLDVVLAKIFLLPEDAGRYALLSLTGKMIYFIGTLFTQFMIPIVSKNEGAGLNSAKSFYQLLFVSSAASGMAYIAFGIFGHISGPILFGSKIAEVVHWLPIYGAAVWMQTIGTGIVAYHQVKNRHAFAYVGFGLALVQVVGMLIWHRDINDLVWVMFGGGAVYLLSLGLLHRYWSQINTIIRNLMDFFGLFSKIPSVAPRSDGRLRILMFNWRDTRHVWAGGAEVYLQQIAKRLVKKGHKVTLFCGNDGHSPRNEVIDGVQIVRRGGFYTVYIWACLYYLLRFRRYFDVLIDSENGIPFFTPLYARKKIFLLIHHVHQEIFRLRLKPPLSWIGQFLEKYLMPVVYRQVEVVTVSPSSKAEILAHRLTRKDPYVVYNGVDLNQYRPGRKSREPLVLYLGRITTQKSVSVFINAAAAIIKQIPRVKFVIAGEGEDKKKLMKLVSLLKLDKYITFTGAVSESEKVKLYQQAWVFVNPSLIEGWGITTIEANACGTPVVASNVPGLRDAVSNPHTGLLVPYGKSESFARAITLLLENKNLRRSMSQGAIDWAKQFDWDKSSRRLLEIL